MKIVVIPDVHGRQQWKKIIKKEKYSIVVFLGDYVSTHDNITPEQQIDNLKEILDFKEKNPNKIVLLRGNHDMQHLDYYWSECSGLFYDVMKWMSSDEVKKRFLDDTQWIFRDGDILFSHAGISKTWLKRAGGKIDNLNNLEPSALWGFCPGEDNIFDNYGASIYQPPTWIRPTALVRDCIDNFIQVVGHTPVMHITNLHDINTDWNNIWLCDTCSEEYLVIDNGKFQAKKVSDLK